MKPIRFSIAILMGVIVYLGFAFAALTHPTPHMSELCLTAAVALLVVAVIGVVYSSRGRAFWGGFLIAGGVFLAFGLLTGVAPPLFPHALADRHYRGLSHAPTSTDDPLWVQWEDNFYEGRLLQPAKAGKFAVSLRNPAPGTAGYTTGVFPPARLRPISPDGFNQLCNAILTPLVGLAGGLVARGFAGRVHRPSPAPEFGP